jgi:hypothetical protein
MLKSLPARREGGDVAAFPFTSAGVVQCGEFEVPIDIAASLS